MMSSYDLSHYTIRGGLEGRERLRLISRVTGAGTESLLDRAGISVGLCCLDVACGGGDVTRLLARRVGPHGKVIGIDADATKIQIARDEATADGVQNVDFIVGDLRTWDSSRQFDVVNARFILEHLPDPAAAVRRFHEWLRPGGLVIVEDIDYSGAFAVPDSTTYRRYCELFSAVVRSRGGDPNMGLRLAHLLREAGFERVSVAISQPVGLEGEVKLAHAVTLEYVADAIVEASLATRSQVDAIVRELYTIAADHETLTATPRIVQAWAHRPATDARDG
jgi:ubiquinone/menaquinone biosynthesis C-methylase UbiE